VSWLAAALVAVAAAGLAGPAGVDPGEAAYTYGVGPFAPEYAPPPPGSYALPPIDAVEDHPLLDSGGRETTLFAEKGGRLAVVAFVYTTCVEAGGCPVSMSVLHQLDRLVAADPALARQVTLLTVSFDPERDTPSRLASVRAAHAPRGDWRFFTTAGEAALDPLLADFGQPVAKLRFADGRWTGLFRHVLKVFLLDRTNQVRNIYSAGFLHAELLLNDLRTLRGEDRG
jgi:cytochrome c peroxidase